VSTTIVTQKSVTELAYDVVIAYKEQIGKEPNFLYMSDAMYRKLRGECGEYSIDPETKDGYRGKYNGIPIVVYNEMPQGVVDAGGWE